VATQVLQHATIDFDFVAGKSIDELLALDVDSKVAISLTDPVEFAWNVLQHTLWPKQEEMLEAIFKYPKVAVKACHASSKTFTAAEAALYWLQRHPDGIVITTAPGERQVAGLLWKEIRDSISTSLLVYPKPTQKKIELTEKNYGMGMATRSDVTAGAGVRFSGFHGGKVLLIIDEAPGVSQDIWDGIQGIMAGGEVHVLALGNPVIPSGPFYDIFHTKRAGWHCITIDAFDTPNLEGLTIADIATMSQADLNIEPSPVPGIINRRWVREMMDELNVDTEAPDELQDPLWQSKVRGQFPTQAEDSLVWLAWIENCRQQERPKGPPGFYTAGVDPAAGGDNETAIQVVEGNHLTARDAWRKKDPRGEAVAFLNTFGDRLKEVRVDVDGVGYYFARHLEDEGFDVVDFHNGGASDKLDKTGKPRFEDLKAECGWNLRELFQAGLVTGEIENVTMSQMAAIRYDHHPKKGTIRLESKDSMKKRGIKSPDHFDAMMMALAGIKRTVVPPVGAMRAAGVHVPAVRNI